MPNCNFIGFFKIKKTRGYDKTQRISKEKLSTWGKRILGQEREKWKGEADVISAQWCLGRKVSVGKNVEEETKGLDCFKSLVSVELTSEYLEIS